MHYANEALAIGSSSEDDRHAPRRDAARMLLDNRSFRTEQGGGERAKILAWRHVRLEMQRLIIAVASAQVVVFSGEFGNHLTNAFGLKRAKRRRSAYFAAARRDVY